jgi:hypothetical protein
MFSLLKCHKKGNRTYEKESCNWREIMNKTSKKLLMASLLSAGAALLTASYRKLQKETIRYIEVTDKKNRSKSD